MSIIHSPLKGDWKTFLLMTGGVDKSSDNLSDAWLLSIGDGASWKEVSVMKEQ